MCTVRFSLFFLAIALLIPGAVRADEDTAEAEQSSCKFPTEVLWHSEEEDDTFRLGVSVLNENEQQMPGLKARNFKVFVDDQEVARDGDSFKVEQSKNVFSAASAADGSGSAGNADESGVASGC